MNEPREYGIATLAVFVTLKRGARCRVASEPELGKILLGAGCLTGSRLSDLSGEEATIKHVQGGFATFTAGDGSTRAPVAAVCRVFPEGQDGQAKFVGIDWPTAERLGPTGVVRGAEEVGWLAARRSQFGAEAHSPVAPVLSPEQPSPPAPPELLRSGGAAIDAGRWGLEAVSGIVGSSDAGRRWPELIRLAGQTLTNSLAEERGFETSSAIVAAWPAAAPLLSERQGLKKARGGESPGAGRPVLVLAAGAAAFEAAPGVQGACACKLLSRRARGIAKTLGCPATHTDVVGPPRAAGRLRSKAAAMKRKADGQRNKMSRLRQRVDAKLEQDGRLAAFAGPGAAPTVCAILKTAERLVLRSEAAGTSADAPVDVPLDARALIKGVFPEGSTQRAVLTTSTNNFEPAQKTGTWNGAR